MLLLGLGSAGTAGLTTTGVSALALALALGAFALACLASALACSWTRFFLSLCSCLVDFGTFPYNLVESILLVSVFTPYIDPRRYPLRVQGQSGGVLVDEF